MITAVPLWGWLTIAATVYVLLLMLFERVAQLTLFLLFALPTVYLLRGVNWDKPITPGALVRMAGAIVFGVNALNLIRIWWRRFNGLDQWPNPSGRFYDRWYDLPPEETRYDYYEWLAREKRWREPWATWAKMEKELMVSQNHQKQIEH